MWGGAVTADFIGADEGLANEDGVAQGVAAGGAAEDGLGIDENYEVIRNLLHVNTLGRGAVRGHRRNFLFSKEGIADRCRGGCAEWRRPMKEGETNLATMVTTKGSTVLHSVLYVSTAQVLFTPPRLEELLTVSRANNARQQITGLLLYRDGAFMQFLEGPMGEVERLYRKIKTDDRHFAIVTISEGAIPHRLFPDLPMGFHNLRDQAVRQLPGFAEFAETSLSMSEFCDEPDRAMQLLGVFERGR